MVNTVEYSPFVIKNSSEISGSCSNVICSASDDNTIRFWDIRSNKKELYLIEGDKEDNGIICLKFISLKKKLKNNRQKLSGDYDVNLFYGSCKGLINYFKIKYKLLHSSVTLTQMIKNKKSPFQSQCVRVWDANRENSIKFLEDILIKSLLRDFH
ncbi:hypothetical protein RFI_39543 [Reticulomyxa filosa]|uniref:WD-40 repeat protein n=1 Tax=Reticulomyxa filosa TaxID=46433 RepID=X6LB82_RETFI|nr:hypothetical protein RFI_39543 [Reticulomyxa filosa]|eukprot:ETN97979.1 hypothetical protein RFI_39543 [Reticulomyxa filosa]